MQIPLCEVQCIEITKPAIAAIAATGNISGPSMNSRISVETSAKGIIIMAGLKNAQLYTRTEHVHRQIYASVGHTQQRQLVYSEIQGDFSTRKKSSISKIRRKTCRYLSRSHKLQDSCKKIATHIFIFVASYTSHHPGAAIISRVRG